MILLKVAKIFAEVNYTRAYKVDESKSISVKFVVTLWLVILVSIFIGISFKLESRIFPQMLAKHSSYYDSFYSSTTIFISTDIQDVDILLFTRKNPVKAQKFEFNQTLSLKSNFDAKKVTKILIHGFSAGIYFAKRFISEYLHAGDYNVIAIDWSKLSSWDNYPVAASNAVLVGEFVGLFLARLSQESSLDPSRIHIIGHSLGSHVGAHVGRTMIREGFKKIGRISALDPAKPWFDGSYEHLRIDKADAQFVDVIHTNSGTIAQGCYSWAQPLGHVDFYPNGGVHQPGCAQLCLFGCNQFDLLDLGGCSHDKAISYFISSIRDEKKFLATKCRSWKDFISGECKNHPTIPMGEHANKKLLPVGKYFLEVRQNSKNGVIETLS